MPERWTLNRAGITNVYQYDDEILQFGGGRLLLRGVNGSGKSTAMNMLLPFLLEADTRRIDAAGEQAGVLRSWMLSGRDDTQPVGYLWVEFRRDEDYLVCGCGIRANRNTDRVTTWWFVTDRRPSIDFSLVENRVPLSIDSLRATLGERAVFAHASRAAYRTEVRTRLFGGADIDQHVRLLHTIRSPRVGDRIDLDLPEHLENALPPLSDVALDDAAQPLEDLEEHRRNVENLTDTSRALSALGAVYRDYARSELHARAGQAKERADAARRQAAAVEDANQRHREAELRLSQAVDDVTRIQGEIDRIGQEMEALRASQAYESGQELEGQRRHVADLEDASRRAFEAITREERRREQARKAVDQAHLTLENDLAAMTNGLGDLGSLASRTGVVQRPPDLPPLVTELESDVTVPAGRWDAELPKRGLSELRGGVFRRHDDVRQAEELLDRVDGAEDELRQAERDRVREEQRLRAAADDHASARGRLTDTTEKLGREMLSWWERLTAMAAHHDAEPFRAPDISVAALIDDRHRLHREAERAAGSLADHHRTALAGLSARLEGEQAEVTRLEALSDELEKIDFPAPPTMPWQRPNGRPRLGELIDFAPYVDVEHQRGVEAAMEAAGLLGAEVTGDGDVVLASGELLAVGSQPVESPLSRLLVVTLPDDARLVPETVEELLTSISTDVASPAATVISPDGTFRIGNLSGHHGKEVVEHIGSVARTAALERQRAEVAALLEDARAVVADTESLRDRHREQLDEVQTLRSELPEVAPVTEALAAASQAEAHLEECHRLVAEAKEREQHMEEAHSMAVSAAQRLAAELSLPSSRTGLSEMRQLLTDASALTTGLIDRLAVIERSHRMWRDTAEAWREAIEGLEEARTRGGELRARHDQAAARLVTLEDSVGLEYQEVLDTLEGCKRDLQSARRRLAAANQEKDAALEARATHREAATQAQIQRLRLEEEAVAELRSLRETLTVAGLRQAAAPEGVLDDLPGVTEDSEGLSKLVRAVKAATPPPDSEVTAEGVRQSLRRRRDTLGAGWDAEDRQPDPALPIIVEVNGPLTPRTTLAAAIDEVAAHLQQQTSLLTAKQDQALRNLLQGLIAREVSDKLVSATELVRLMNQRLGEVATSHGVGVQLKWSRRDDLDPHLATTIDLLGKPPDLRTPEEDDRLIAALSERIADARAADPELAYRDLVRRVLDYRQWHEMAVYVTRAGENPKKLGRRTPLSEGEKKIVSYLALFAAVAASCDALAGVEPTAPRFVLLDDAFAKVSEDNHAKLFGLMVEMDLDFIATSERLWGTHATVPELAITEVIRDAELSVILLEHSRWDGATLEGAP